MLYRARPQALRLTQILKRICKFIGLSPSGGSRESGYPVFDVTGVKWASGPNFTTPICCEAQRGIPPLESPLTLTLAVSRKASLMLVYLLSYEGVWGTLPPV